tara:strand:+ start:244 stop:588 length:345 start_codon:yes stop_codon:yes gene_type:complete
MAKGDDTKLDENFGVAMFLIFFSGVGTLIGGIYYLVSKYIFGKEKADLTKGFRKNTKKVRFPAMVISLLIFTALVYILYLLSIKLVPVYDQTMNKLFTPVEEEINELDQLRQSG